jgi:hypothetical protein
VTELETCSKTRICWYGMQLENADNGDDGANGRDLNMFSLRLCQALNQFGLGRMSSSDVYSSSPHTCRLSPHARDKQESREQTGDL